MIAQLLSGGRVRGEAAGGRGWLEEFVTVVE